MYTNEEAQFLAKAQAGFKKDYKKKRLSNYFVSALVNLVLIMIAVAAIFMFILDCNSIYGDGMSDTFSSGSPVISNRLAYMMSEPQRGDIILTDTNIYRIIALPGETVEIYGGHIYIDGEFVKEEYQLENVLTYPVVGYETLTVPEGAYYCLCDNRKCYDDSRLGNAISRQAIRSKALFAF